MIYFRSDYSQGAHPKVLEALAKTNMEHTDGYGLDEHCSNAADIIRKLIGRPDAAVHMMTGGTSCNITVIAAALRPYETVISPRTGHAYFHETGGVEATGHRVAAVDTENGRLTPQLIDKVCNEYEDEHTPKPGMVYISQPAENGSIYSRAEMKAISDKCREKGLLLYVDGARLSAALTCRENDLDIKELASLCDAFYIGGTKSGALFGEALVINEPRLDDHFRWMIKRQGGMLAKGRLIGVQFETLLEGGEKSLYYEIGFKENLMAERLRTGMKDLGIAFYSDSPTNQLFPCFPESVLSELEKDFFFYRWAPEENGLIPIRLVCGWGTSDDDVEAFLSALKIIYQR